MEAKPVLYWDGDCGFCARWVGRWRDCTGDLVDYVKIGPDAPQPVLEAAGGLPPQRVVLQSPGADPVGGAAAALGALATANRGAQLVLWLYRKVPMVRVLMEAAYRLVAAQRSLFAGLTRLVWGGDVRRPRYRVSGWLFPRLIGAIYVCAFVSLWVQVDGLAGERGILPARDYLAGVATALAQSADSGPPPPRLLAVPSVLWLDASDRMIHLTALVGLLASVAMVLGLAPPMAAVTAWLSYLSLVSAIPVFFNYQWDALLLEAGFLTIFFAPWAWRGRWGNGAEPVRWARLLVWWLLFRLMFQSAVVKFHGYDATGLNAWLEGTALHFHYFTQPLPVWTSWWFGSLPDAWHRVSVVATLAIELILPFFIFAPRNLRLLAFAGFALLQGLIMASGHYGFFNLLTLVLAITLLDDLLWPRSLRRGLTSAPPLQRAACSSRWQRGIVTGLAVILVAVTSVQTLLTLRWASFAPVGQAPITLPSWFLPVLEGIMPLRIANSYGLFSVMTTDRPEISLECSADNVEWHPVRFRWKMEAEKAAAPFLLPHMPRLDWQMWFAALEYRATGRPPVWLLRFLLQLQNRSPAVEGLLEAPPVPGGASPQYFRLRLDLLEFAPQAPRWQSTPLPEYNLEGTLFPG